MVFVSAALLSDTLTLGDAGITNGDVVTLNERTLHVKVRLPTELHGTFGYSLIVAVGPTDTVGDVLAKIEAHTGVLVAKQLLSDDTGSTLSSGSTLASLNVEDGDTLFLDLASTTPPATYIVEVNLPASLHAKYGPSIKIATASTATVGELKVALEVCKRDWDP